MPSYVRLATHALIRMCTQADVNGLQLGVTCLGVNSDVQHLSDLHFWDPCFRSGARVVRTFDPTASRRTRRACWITSSSLGSSQEQRLRETDTRRQRTPFEQAKQESLPCSKGQTEQAAEDALSVLDLPAVDIAPHDGVTR